MNPRRAAAVAGTLRQLERMAEAALAQTLGARMACQERVERNLRQIDDRRFSPRLADILAQNLPLARAQLAEAEAALAEARARRTEAARRRLAAEHLAARLAREAQERETRRGLEELIATRLALRPAQAWHQEEAQE